MEAFEKKTLSEIYESGNKEDEALYFSYLASLETSKIAKDIIERYEGASIEEIYNRRLQAEEEITSQVIFPGQMVILYPNIKERRAKDFITCDFSAGIIYPGSLYVSYRPLLDNLTTKETYVLKRTIKVEAGHYTDLPTTIQEFEGLELKMQMSYESDFSDNTGIEYSHLSQRTGGEFVLQKLKRRK